MLAGGQIIPGIGNGSIRGEMCQYHVADGITLLGVEAEQLALGVLHVAGAGGGAVPQAVLVHAGDAAG